MVDFCVPERRAISASSAERAAAISASLLNSVVRSVPPLLKVVRNAPVERALTRSALCSCNSAIVTG